MKFDSRELGDKRAGGAAPSGGLALDIDETLAWTVGLWFRLLSERFGNPEYLTPRELETKYEFTFRVPYWQGPEVLEFMERERANPERQLEIEVMPGALDGVAAILGSGQSLACYLTTRPVAVAEATALWLRRVGFPDLPVLARPEAVGFQHGDQWKVDEAHRLFPHVSGIIDNSGSVVRLFGSDYPGRVYHFSAKERIREDLGDRLVACATWSDVAREVVQQRAREVALGAS